MFLDFLTFVTNFYAPSITGIWLTSLVRLGFTCSNTPFCVCAS